MAMITDKQWALMDTILKSMEGEPFFTYVTAGSAATLGEAGYVVQNPELHTGHGITRAYATKLTQEGIDALQTHKNPPAAELATSGAAWGTPPTAAVAPVAEAAPAATSAKEKRVFEIETDVTMPDKGPGGKRGGAFREEQYPFSKLEVGHSFFVPNTAKMPDAVKSMYNTAQQATRRFDVVSETQTRTTRTGKVVPVTTETRKFEVRPGTRGAESGARIWRTK